MQSTGSLVDRTLRFVQNYCNTVFLHIVVDVSGMKISFFSFAETVFISVVLVTTVIAQRENMGVPGESWPDVAATGRAYLGQDRNLSFAVAVARELPLAKVAVADRV